MTRRLILTLLAAAALALLGGASDRAAAGQAGEEPIAQWRFDGNASDSTGNGHDATELGGVEYMGGAADMDGLDDAFQVADAPDLNPADAITVAAWWSAVDFTGSGNNGLVDKGFTSHDPPHYQYHLGVTGPGWPGGPNFGFQVALDGTAVSTRIDGWTPGQLYYLVGTYDGSELRLYVNGALESSRAASGSISDYGQDLFIGRYTNLQIEGANFLPGALDEVTIWGRALSADEVAELYDSGPAQGNGEAPPSTGGEETPTTEPDELDTPTSAAAADETPTSEADAQQSEDDGSSFPWWLIVLILIILALIILILLYLRRRKREQQEG